jgi:hypothetical protein
MLSFSTYLTLYLGLFQFLISYIFMACSMWFKFKAVY